MKKKKRKIIHLNKLTEIQILDTIINIKNSLSTRTLRESFFNLIKAKDIYDLIPIKCFNDNIQNFNDLCDVIFSQNIYRFKYKIMHIIKQNISKKIIEKLLTPFIIKDESLPKLYSHQRNLLICKLYGIEYGPYKRNIENENLKNLNFNQVFIKLKNILIPHDIVIIIFSYFKKDKKFLNNIGVINEEFYLICLKSWTHIYVNGINLYKIPIIVLQYCTKIRIDPKQMYVEDINYFHQNTHNYKTLIITNISIQYRNILFFKHLNIKKPNCKKIDIANLYSIHLKSELFPNVKTLIFKKIFNSVTKKKIPYKMEEDTKKFLINLDNIKINGILKTYNRITYTNICNLYIPKNLPKTLTKLCISPEIFIFNIDIRGNIFIETDFWTILSKIFNLRRLKFYISLIYFEMVMKELGKHQYLFRHLTSIDIKILKVFNRIFSSNTIFFGELDLKDILPSIDNTKFEIIKLIFSNISNINNKIKTKWFKNYKIKDHVYYKKRRRNIIWLESNYK
jgi:hypothetical protein